MGPPRRKREGGEMDCPLCFKRPQKPKERGNLFQRISATNRVPTFTVPLTNHNSAIQTIQDFSAETVFKKNSDSVATPSCHLRPTNQDTLSQAGPPTSGHIHNPDMGWRNASRSVSQRRLASAFKERGRTKETERARKRRGLVVLGSGEEDPGVLVRDADQES
ncbi:hypothetical protein TNCV_740211 [Trichonephila clavipes]|nr:hypothetical protein TNCV_740211 [Trichonephila clavipes]